MTMLPVIIAVSVAVGWILRVLYEVSSNRYLNRFLKELDQYKLGLWEDIRDVKEEPREEPACAGARTTCLPLKTLYGKLRTVDAIKRLIRRL